MKLLLRGLIALGPAAVVAAPASADTIRLFECDGKSEITFMLAKSDGVPLTETWQTNRFFLFARSDPPEFQRMDLVLRSADEKTSTEIYENRTDDPQKATTTITLFTIVRTPAERPKDDKDKPKPAAFKSLSIWVVEYTASTSKTKGQSTCKGYVPKPH